MSELLQADQVEYDNETIRTQISGKYSPDNLGVFEFKQQLVAAGLDVRFPVGDEIIEYECGFAITVPHEKTTPFPRTEVQFLREIKNNHLQTTYNMYGDQAGYMGESTSLETACALVYDKPIVLVRELGVYSPTAPPSIMRILEKYSDAFIIEPIDKLKTPELALRLGEVAATGVEYGLTRDEKATVMSEALTLTRKYQATWLEYTAQ